MLTHELASTIRDVVVHREGAVVTRLCSVEAGAWAEEIVLGNLPLSLIDGSVRARVEVEGAATAPQPSDVRVEIQAPPLGEPIEAPSEAALREAREEVARLEWLLRRIEDEVALLEKVSYKLPERIEREPPRPLHDAVMRGTASWIERARTQRVERRAELRAKRRQAEEKRDRLERQAQQARAERGVDETKVCKRVRVRFETVQGAGAGRLLVEYQVPGARWRPAYVLRVARDGTRADLAVRALVCQASGEPWGRIRLGVSSADLSREIELPELRSLRIGRRQAEPPKRAWRDTPTGAFTLFEGLDRFLQSTPRPTPGAFSDEEVTAPGGPSSGGPQGSVEIVPESYPSEPMAEYDDDEAMDALDEPMAVMDAEMDYEVSERMESTEEIAEAELTRTPAAPAMMAANMAPPAPPPSAPMRSAPRGAMAKESAPILKKAMRMRMESAKAMMADGAMAFGSGVSLDDDDADEITRDVLLSQLQVAQGAMQYSELRLVGWKDPQHARGSLRQVGLRDALEDLTPSALRQVERVLSTAQRRALHLDPFAPATQSLDRSAGSFDYRYDATGPVDVPADGKVHSVPLFTEGTRVEMTLVVVPRESDQAVRVASLENPLKAPLLAGPAEIYLEDEFLVDSRLDTVPKGGRIDIGLGVEEALKVARNTHFKESTQGLLRGGLGLEHSIEIELGSRLGALAHIEVRERIPHAPRDAKDSLVVEEGAIDPPWEKWTQSPEHRLEAGRRWRLDLKPGETRTLKASYVVHIDAKDELVGGNRRERGAR
ncbi:MAG: DUF4139 domain-containing protein [Pseudomonadota bacterium]